jgi:hypothetical protein
LGCTTDHFSESWCGRSCGVIVDDERDTAASFGRGITTRREDGAELAFQSRVGKVAGRQTTITGKACRIEGDGSWWYSGKLAFQNRGGRLAESTDGYAA